MGAEGSSTPTAGVTSLEEEPVGFDEEVIVNGVLVRDIVSGFEGIVLCTTEWWNGCVRVSVYPRGLNDKGEMLKANTFDLEQLEYVGPGLTTEVVVEVDGVDAKVGREVTRDGPGGDREDAGARAEVP